MQAERFRGSEYFEPTREPFLSGPHQDDTDATKAVPNQKNALTAILDPEKEMLK
ncbi:hypothetical protein [Mesorhizobium sp.]|uniref:hypothetical protein n=1 Tax=Mesorhizobium sp. TaxID=1871066 RepID=UPI0025FAE08D|nr:hypothetical protein [Mesorhizobium sp.]